MRKGTSFAARVVVVGLTIAGLLGPTAVVAAQPVDGKDKALGRLSVPKSKAGELTDFKAEHGQAQAKKAAAAWSRAAANGATALREQRMAAAAAATEPTKINGDVSATPLSPSASWSAGGSSGSFSWSYPIALPPTAAGPTPTLELSYDSGSVDGRLPSANNQPSGLGEGFDFTQSFIERSYGSCEDDGQDNKFDRCWMGDQVSLTLNGHANRLIKVDDGRYRLERDDASKVEHKTGNNVNGDNNGEYWVVTTGDGVQYTFGLSKLPGADADAPTTSSVWTVPVFGDDSGEPCHDSAGFAQSSCKQAWKWNLDYVVDLHGNAATYWYTAEHNNYAKNGDTSPGTDYIRGGYLKRIDYGLRKDNLFDNDTSGKPTVVHKAPQSVVLTWAERCLQSGSDCDSLVKDSKDYWPDVPFDSICNDGATCDEGRSAPSFFTRKLLTKITSRVATASGYDDVDKWDFDHLFLDAGEVGDTTDQTLWLSSITRTGLVGGTLAMPPVKFTPIMLENRVDGGSDDILPLGKPRVYTITAETGSVTIVAYSEPDCWAGNSEVPARLPTAADSNKMRCYPSYWSPNGERTPKKDWFQKYVVIGVDQSDPSGGAADLVTRYVYGDGDATSNDAAWHFSARPMTPKREQTWSEWRGYDRVTTLTGDPGREPIRSKIVSIYLRGMDGDKNAGSDPPKNVSVTGIKAPGIADSDQYAGFTREQVQYNGMTEAGATGAEVSGTINDPWSTSSASQTFPATTVDGTTYPAVTFKSWMVRTKTKTLRTRLSSGTPIDRLAVSDTTFDTTYGMPTQVDSYTVPNAAVPATRKDQLCERTWYARNPAINLITPIARSQTVAVACSATPSMPANTATPGDVVSDNAILYDSTTMATAGSWNAQVPTLGDQKYVGRPTGYASGAPSGWQKIKSGTYDALGRKLDELDAKANKTSTTYVPAGAGVAVSQSVKNALSQPPTVKKFDQNRGQVVSVTDANNKLTETAFDALGRATAVWTPITSRALGSPPAAKYAYHLGSRQADGSSDETWVSTSVLVGNTDTYRTSYEFFDALLRPLQTQKPSPSGGRVITETTYDSRGFAAQSYADVYDPAQEPSGERQGIVYGRAPSQTETTYDGAGRPTLARFLVGGIEHHRTGTEYTGDSVASTPPTGGTATREFVDALARVTERRQYNGNQPTGTYLRTLMTYRPNGVIESIKGPDDALWTYGYDMYGRQVSSSDPDKGTSTTTYTTLDQVDTTKDARGTILLYDYDALGRKIVEYATSRTTANKQSDWTYDGVAGAVGYPSGSNRYVGGLAYGRKITAYDPMYRVKTSQVVLPTSDVLVSGGALPATSSASVAYNRDGTIQSATEPAVGGLPAETISVGYNAIGTPVSSQGATGYVLGTVYDSIGQPLQLSLGVSATAASKAFITHEYEAGTHKLVRSSVTDTVHPWMAQDLQYRFDPSGNVTGIADSTTLGGTSHADFQCFGYDGYGELAEAWTPKTDDCSVANRSVANLSTGTAAYWNSFKYTSAGMRDTATLHRVNGDTVTKYNYGTAACAGSTTRKHVLSTAVTTAPGVATATATYGCDQVGNTTARPGPAKQQTLTWNPENKLSRVVEATTTPKDTTYIYDADGGLLIRRPTSNSAGETVLFLGGTELHSTKASASATPVVTGLRYYSHAGQVVAVRSATKGVAGSKLAFTFSDHHGTSSVALDATTLAVTKRFMAPFGVKRAGSWVDDKGFLGKTADASTGLTHVGAREYDPGLGRFISGDPVLDATDGLSLNGFAYANNNPLTKSDPTGEMFIDGGGGHRPPSTGVSAPWSATAAEHTMWWQVWTPRHDTAVAMRAQATQGMLMIPPGMGKVTTTRKDNFIAGASAANPGDENGYADLILWTDTTVYVWEVKHAGGQAEASGQAQVDNYVTYLQQQLLKQGDKRRVTTGFPFPFSQSGPNMANPSETITVFSKSGGRGVELYTWTDPAKERAKIEQQEREQAEAAKDKDKGGGSPWDFVMAGGLALAATGIVVATLAEDVATGGVGVADDPATLGGAAALYRSAFALAS